MNEAIQQHYAAPGLLDRITQGLAKMGKARDRVTIDDLGAVDEFHLGGAQVTIELIDRLGVTPDMHVLDVGSGLGGPARRLAETTGCRVTGVDLSADFCETGGALNAWTGLADKVTLVQGDGTNLSTLGAALFDAAWTLHVGMNIADKLAFYNGIFSVLKPGGRFLVYDVLAVDGREALYPAPWARDPKASFLCTQSRLRDHLDGAGFVVDDAQDRSVSGLAFLDKGLEKIASMPSPPPLGLHLVLGPSAGEILPLVRRNLAEGRVAVGLFACHKPA